MKLRDQVGDSDIYYRTRGKGLSWENEAFLSLSDLWNPMRHIHANL